MKAGDPFKPFNPAGGAPAKTAKVVEQGVESLVGTAGKLLRGDAARTLDTFEKAAAPALQAMLGAGRAGIAGGAATAESAGAAIYEAARGVLGGLDAQLGRAESQTRSLIRQIDELRARGAEAQGTAKSGGDLAASLLDSLGVAADRLAQAQEIVAAESFLESMIGRAGRLARGDAEGGAATLSRGLAGLEAVAEIGRAGLEAGAAAAQWAGEDVAATSRAELGGLTGGLAEVENQIQLVLRQIEQLRSREAAEQEAAQTGSDAADPISAAAALVSDAYAAVRDALDP